MCRGSQAQGSPAMSSILHNVAALGATRRLEGVGTDLERSLQRLTSGRRVNRASDDAAGLAISTSLAAATRVALQGRRNAQDGISCLQVADGALDEVTRMLSRASELAQQARTGTLSSGNRAALDAEFQGIQAGMNAVLAETRFNGATVFVADATTTVQSAAGSYAAQRAEGYLSAASTPDAAPTRNGWDLLAAVALDVMGLQSSPSDALPADLLAALQDAANQACGAALSGVVGALGDMAGTAMKAAASLLEVAPADSNALSLWLMASAVHGHPPHPGGPDFNSAVEAGKAASGQRTFTTTGASLVQAVGGYAPVTLTTDPSAIPTALGAITTAAGAAAAQAAVAGALDAVAGLRASLGAGTQQLAAIANALGLQVEGFTRSGSQIRDADLADEVVKLTRFRILNRAGNAALARANDAARHLVLLLA